MWKWFYGASLHAKADRLGTYASALAYCLVLSLVPFLMVTFALGQQLAPRLDWGKPFAEILRDIFPTDVLHPAQVVNAVEISSHRGLATFGFLLAVYTSYTLMTQIVRTLLFIFDDSRRGSAAMWTVGLKTVGLFAVWMSLLLVISFCSFFALELRHPPHHAHASSGSWAGGALFLTDLGMIGALFAAFYLTYTLIATRRFSRTSLRNGSLIATGGWIVGSFVFSNLLPQLWRFNTVYQALGSLVVVLVWAQVCAWSVIGGALWIVRFSPRRKSA